MKKVVVGIVSAAALATIGMAAASNSMAASSSGVFVSGNLGYGEVNLTKSHFSPAASSIKTGDLAWNTNVGYQFNRYLAVEAGYISFGEAKATINSISTTATETLSGFGANVKGMLPVGTKFDVFAKAGAIDMHDAIAINSGSSAIARVSGNAWTPDLGVGVAYNVNKHIALTAQDVYAFSTSFKSTEQGAAGKVNVPSANAVLAGISYKF